MMPAVYLKNILLLFNSSQIIAESLLIIKRFSLTFPIGELLDAAYAVKKYETWGCRKTG